MHADFYWLLLGYSDMQSVISISSYVALTTHKIDDPQSGLLKTYVSLSHNQEYALFCSTMMCQNWVEGPLQDLLSHRSIGCIDFASSRNFSCMQIMTGRPSSRPYSPPSQREKGRTWASAVAQI